MKRDFERFPRAQIVGDKTPWPIFGGPRTQVTGSLQIELLSPCSDANRDADARAFAALMRHVKEVDGRQHTVIAIQVENEMGIQGDTRDRSPLANAVFEGQVPKELMDYLQKYSANYTVFPQSRASSKGVSDYLEDHHKYSLVPELRQVWEAAGFKTSGTWQEVFGKGRPTDEIFMAWCFAQYVERVVEAGKTEYPIPMITNCPQFGFGKEPAPIHRGGQSGGPMPDAMNVYRAGAPQIDLFAADIYSTDYTGFCAKYTQSGNPLFIAETGGGRDITAKALYAFGRHDAICFSPFGIDRSAGSDSELGSAYKLISQLAPLILEHQGNGTMSTVLMGAGDTTQKVKVGNYTIEVAAAKVPRRTAAAGAAARSRRRLRWRCSLPRGLTSTLPLAAAYRSPSFRARRGPPRPVWAPWRKARSSMAAGSPAAAWRATTPSRGSI